MPVNVPTEPKKYTTVYENFKGVDFTNDASNVYKRRSPGGKNMMPDLDGRPYKRKGWKVEYTAQDFIDAAGSSATTVTPKRIHHFSLGGKEYLMMFNSIGVFYTAEDMDTVVKCQLATIEDDEIVTSAFPPLIDGNVLEADSGRTFFFESNGVAGLYTFVGMALFRFDGEYFWRVDPYVPKFLIACDADGAGQVYENINLLTNERMVCYQCDGTNKYFVVPSGIDTTKTFTVETLSVSGEWETKTLNTDYTYSDGVLTFTVAPAEVQRGEDCMRVTYSPANVTAYTATETLTASATQYETYWITGMRWYFYPVRAGAMSFNGSGVGGTLGSSTISYSDATFKLTNPKNTNALTLTPSGGTTTVNAYSNTVTYRPPQSEFANGETSYHTEQVIKTTVKVYYSTDYTTLYNAVKNNSYSSVSYAGSFGTNNVPEDDQASMTRIRDELVAFTTAHQARYSTEYYYAFTYTEDAQYRKGKSVSCSLTYDRFEYVTLDDDNIGNDKTAFSNCQRATVYGSGLINQIFVGASISNGYSSRLWYSGVGSPNYFPDLNYVEVGSNDTRIMGMMKCGEYLGIIKAGNALDSSVYLAFPTSFGDDTTYAVKQSIAGVGALSMGAFNIIADESVFLSPEGVMAIEFGGDNRLRNRSYFVDKRLCAEENLADAVSYVFKNMYYLSINNHCYVLDGSQKNSWVNEKTNLQYECYYLENVPAQCFGDMGGRLWFTDYDGNLCRFKDGLDPMQYRDEYTVGHMTIDADDMNVVNNDGFTVEIGELQYTEGGTTHVYTRDELEIGMVVRFYSAGEFSITGLTDETVRLDKGVPVHAVWDTIADDDGAIHFFKNLNKKGFVISLLPGSSSGVRVSLKPDEKDAIVYGTTDANGNLLPFDYYVRKKVKKYKRLQIICENNGIDQSFGIDQILKTYTLGNYSKNRK